MAKKSTWTGVVEPGIRKYQGPHGEHWYRVQLGTRGRGNRGSKVCTTLDEAVRKKAEYLAGGVPVRNAPTPPETPEPTVEDQLRLYRALRPKLDGDIKSTLAVLDRDYPELLGFRAMAVTSDHCAVFVTRYTHDGTRKPSGIRRHLYTLQAALRVIRPDWLIDKSVFPPELPRHPQLTPLQLKRVRLVLREPFLTIALVASLNFMRLSELLRLRREHVDFVTGTCLLHRAKAGPRTVPMGTVVATLLRQHLATHGHALVFPKRNGQPYSRFTVWEQWHAAMVAIGRPGFSFHDLRHHAAMTALEHGASFPELQALGGWARPDMVNRYATASNAHLRALQDLGARRATKLVARRRS